MSRWTLAMPLFCGGLPAYSPASALREQVSGAQFLVRNRKCRKTSSGSLRDRKCILLDAPLHAGLRANFPRRPNDGGNRRRTGEPIDALHHGQALRMPLRASAQRSCSRRMSPISRKQVSSLGSCSAPLANIATATFQIAGTSRGICHCDSGLPVRSLLVVLFREGKHLFVTPVLTQQHRTQDFAVRQSPAHRFGILETSHQPACRLLLGVRKGRKRLPYLDCFMVDFAGDAVWLHGRPCANVVRPDVAEPRCPL